MGKLSAVRAVVGVAVAVAASVFVLKRLRKQSQQGPVVVTQLHMFPIKSCSSVPVQEITVTRRGVLYDREWCIFRRNNLKFCSQREHPSIKLLCATISEAVDGSAQLRVSVIEDAVSCVEVAAHRPLLLPICPRDSLDVTNQLVVDIFGLSGTVVDEGPEAAAWFSAYLGVDVFLGRVVGARHPKEVAAIASHIPEASTDINLQDIAPLHVCTEEAVEHLQRELNDHSINVFRFRPNIVARGVAFPLEERWKTFQIAGTSGDAPLSLKVVKLMDRCSMPTITDKGERNAKYLPTAFLKKTHGVAEHGSAPCPMFGLAVFPDVDPDTFTTHKVRVGDRINVQTLTPPRVYEVCA